MIQRGGQRASSPCALESQQGVSQSWYPSVSQSVSYPVPTAIGYTQSTSRAGMRAGLGGCTQAAGGGCKCNTEHAMEHAPRQGLLLAWALAALGVSRLPATSL